MKKMIYLFMALFMLYTVYADSTTIQAVDDAFQNETNMTLGSYGIELGYLNRTAGFQFNLSIPKRANILNAYLNLSDAGVTDNPGDINTTIFIENISQSEPFGQNETNITNRVKSNNFVEWELQYTGTFGSRHISPNISELIQVVVNNGDYLEGNNITLMLNTTGDPYIDFISIDSGESAEYFPKLYVEWENCYDPQDDLIVTNNITFCPGSFYLNDSGLDGIIRVEADDVTVTCNQTIFYGNSSSIGIFSELNDSITVQGCTFYDYHTSIRAGDYNTIYNNSFYNEGFAGIYVTGKTGLNASNNYFNDSHTAIYLFSNSNNSIIESNNISYPRYGIDIRTNGDNNTVRYNEFNYGNRSNPVNVYIRTNSDGNKVYNNTFNYPQRGIRLEDTSTNSMIENNTFFNASLYAIEIYDGTGNISNNNFTRNFIAIRNYEDGFHSGSLIEDNYFYNSSSRDIQLYADNLSLLSIVNNTFHTYQGAGGVHEEQTISKADNIFVASNYFYQYGAYNSMSVRQYGGSNWDIVSNVFFGSGVIFSEAMKIEGNDSKVRFNVIQNTQYNIWLSHAYNITVTNNTVFNGDQGSWIEESDLVYFENNSLINITLNYDFYNTGLKILNSSNVFVRYNNWTEVATNALIAQGNYNVTIANNSVDFIPLSERGNYNATDGDEPRCAFQVTKRYKGYYNTFGNDNITIINNIFDSDTPCYLYSENVTQLTQDFNSYWYRKFEVPTSDMGPFEFFIPNYYANISSYTGGVINYTVVADFGGSSTKHIQFNISNTSMAFKNINETDALTVTVYNLSLAGPYNFSYWDNNSVINATGEQISESIPVGRIFFVGLETDIPKLVLEIISPLYLISFSNNTFTNFTFNLTCQNQDCGVINTSIYYNGTTNLLSNISGVSPLYTNKTNPNITSLNKDESILLTYYINSTGVINNTYYLRPQTMLSNGARSVQSDNVAIFNITSEPCSDCSQTTGGGGGGSYQPEDDNPYQLYVTINSEKYQESQILKATVKMIVNKSADGRSVNITHYFLDQNQTIINAENLYIGLVNKTCNYGEYNAFKDVCEQGDLEYEANPTVFVIEKFIPNDISSGKYSFNIMLQDNKKVSTFESVSFNVVGGSIMIIALMGVVLLSYVYSREKNKKGR